MDETRNAEIRVVIRERYGQYAQQGPPSSCCSSAPAEPCASQLYQLADIADLPDSVTGLSLGCGDPVTLAQLRPGQTVLDLGSGGGIDCFLAAKRVGPTGRVIGVDMTPDMIERARANKQRLGAGNVEFRLGEIEHLPVADNAVDVIISNCVINLSTDKPQVFRESFRVLKPGGKLSVSDIVTDGPLPAEIRASLSAWAGCIAGAMEVDAYLGAMRAAGFTDINLTPVYMEAEMIDEASAQLSGEIDLSGIPAEALQKAVFSAKIVATKPAG